MGTRTRTDAITTPWVSVTTYPLGNKSPVTETGELPLLSYRESFTGTDVPGWRSAIKRGTVVFNNCTHEKLTCQVLPLGTQFARYQLQNMSTGLLEQDVFQQVTGTTTLAKWTPHSPTRFMRCGEGGHPFVTGLPDYVSQSHIDRAITKSFAKAADSDVSALVTIGEAGETVGYLTSVLPRLRKLPKMVMKLRKRDFTLGGVLKITERTLPLWLEWRYAVRPLVSEIQSYVKLASDPRKRRRTRYVSSLAVDDTVRTFSDTDTSSGYTVESDAIISRMCILKSGVAVEHEPHGLMYDLGADRVLSSAWDLVPFSFIADWFVNIGETIAAHEGRYGQTVKYAWYSRTDVDIRSASQKHGPLRIEYPATQKRYTSTSNIALTASERFERYERVRITQAPILPSLKINLDWKKFLDLSLIGSQLRKSMRHLRE